MAVGRAEQAEAARLTRWDRDCDSAYYSKILDYIIRS